MKCAEKIQYYSHTPLNARGSGGGGGGKLQNSSKITAGGGKSPIYVCFSLKGALNNTLLLKNDFRPSPISEEFA